MPSSSPSSARHPQYLATGYSQSRIHFFFLLRTAAGFLSRLLFLPFRFLKFLSIRPFSFLSSMNDLTDDDFFNATDDGVADQGDADELFPFGRPHAATEVCNREDRLYLVPYWWWLDAKESCLGDSDKAGAVLYTSNLRSPDSYLVEEERIDSKLEVVFRLREEPVALIEEVEKEALGVEDKEEGCSGVEDKEEGCSSCEYALLYEFMWFKALKWYNDSMVAQKLMRCSLTGKDTTWDIIPIQIRLSALPQANSFHLKICLVDNISHYKRACKLFDQQSNMLHIWDFSGQISNFLSVDGKFTSVGAFQADAEILVELQVFGASAIDEDVEWRPAHQKVEVISMPVNSGDSLSKMNSEIGGEKTESSAVSQPCVKQCKGVSLLGLRGLVNLGNTCFMNSAIQCLVHTEKLVDYFLGDYKKDLNHCNPLGMKGELALTFGELLRRLWAPGRAPIAPSVFKSTLGCFAPSFSGYNQHDSQEFLAFLLDGLHEDLNRVKSKPYIEAKDADDRPDKEVADEYWQNYLARNDSIIVDLFQGQYRSTLACLMCNRVSITFDPFMYLSLPLPSTTMRTMTLTLVSTDGISPPTGLTVTVPLCGRLKDLIQALSTACSLGNDESLLIAEVYNNCILHFLEEPYDSLDLIRDHDCLVVYRLPKERENWSLIVFMHQHNEGELLSKSWQIFGTPLVTRVCNISTGSQIHEEFVKLVAPLLRPDVDNYEDNENLGSGWTDMGDASIENLDDSSSSNGEPERTLSGKFQFCRVDQQCACRGPNIKMSTPLNFSSTTENIYVLVSWPNQMMMKYDTSCLSSLPEIFSPGVSAKRSKESVSLSRCLEAFLKEDPLGPDDMWYCPGCKKHRQAMKKLDLWRLPEVLVIQLKRFSYSRFLRSKLETYIDFPIKELEMSGYIPCNNISTSFRYKLYAVSNHYGGMGGGHYTALVNYADEWYEFDDSRVASISDTGVKTSAAYVLFYQRVHETSSNSAISPSPVPPSSPAEIGRET